MKKTLIYLLFTALLSLQFGCGGSDDGYSPDGVWCYMDSENNTICKLIIGGSNAISSGGTYTRLSIIKGVGDYDILLGGGVYNEKTESGIITFTESEDGSPNYTFVTLISSMRLMLRFDSNSNISNEVYTLTKTENPISLAGNWGGEMYYNDNKVTINTEIYPEMRDNIWGKITVSYPGLDQSSIYNITRFNYNQLVGDASFRIETTTEDQPTIEYTGNVYYDYDLDVIKGIAVLATGDLNYEFTLSPTLSWSTTK